MEKQPSNNRLQWLNLMVSEPYYIFHFMIFFSYVVFRTSATRVLAPHITHDLLHREIQVLFALALLAAIKMVKEETWEAFLADMLFYAKICIFALTFKMDERLAVWYLVSFLVVHIFSQQPLFGGLGTSNKLTPLQLETALTEGNTSRLWMVEFHTSYLSSCVRASRCFPELATIYSNKNMSFGMVDLGLFPNAAEKFGISLSGNMGQLPTYILFENATEVARFPEWNFQAKFFNPTITKRLLCRRFEMDHYLLEYIYRK